MTANNISFQNLLPCFVSIRPSNSPLQGAATIYRICSALVKAIVIKQPSLFERVIKKKVFSKHDFKLSWPLYFDDLIYFYLTMVSLLIIKITISSIVIGLKNSYFPLILFTIYCVFLLLWDSLLLDSLLSTDSSISQSHSKL